MVDSFSFTTLSTIVKYDIITKMALSKDVLTILSSYPAGYRLMRQQLLNPTTPHLRKRSVVNQKTLYTTLARLQKQGLVGKKNVLWIITKKGGEILRKRLNNFLPTHSHKVRHQVASSKNMIVAFDIPEKYRKKRDWLRIELVLLEFSPIQKSVWFGKAPLPRTFINSLNELNILSYIKFFEAKEASII